MLTSSALLWTRIGAGVCLLIVANLVYALWTSKQQVAAGKRWSKTVGKIVGSSVSSPQVMSGDEAECTVDIRYQYRVGAKDFEGSRIRFGGHAQMSQMAADALTAKYPQGAAIDVFYDPKVPAHAVLEPSNKSNVTGIVIFLILFGIASVVLVAHGIAGKVLTTSGGLPMFALALPLLAILVGVAAFAQYFIQRGQQSASMRWPSVPGKITQVNIAVEQREDDSHEGQIRTIRLYRPDIRYSYNIGNRELHGSVWKWGWTALYPDEDSARKTIAKYTIGASVPVFYDPAKPDDAMLEPGNRSGTAATLVFGAMFALGGGFMFWAFATMGGWQ